MERKLDIQNELIEISPTVALIPYVNIYKVAPDYFENFPFQISILCNKNEHFYTVPNVYFDNLSSIILQKIKEEEIDELPEIFNSISKGNVFQTPPNYFEKIHSKPLEQAKIITLTTKNKTTTWLKYAVAACSIAIISFFAVNFFNTKSKPNEDAIIAGTSISYKEIKNMDVDKALASLPSLDLNNYLCENGLVACSDIKADETLEKELDNLNISDEDLDKLIEETN
jgi:hypothetical protein